VLLVHRPKYDDWSFPKGKLDPREDMTAAAVREVAEETGVDIRLGPPLSTQTYQVRNGGTRTKVVHYWVGRLVGDGDVNRYEPNNEIDQVAWVGVDKAYRQLTYEHDRDTIDEFLELRKPSHPLVVLRHSRARSRKGWRKDDRDRPLTREGELQSLQLVPVLAAYGVARVVTSSSRRCRDTVAPYAGVADIEIEETDALAEEGATPSGVDKLVHELLTVKEPLVLCTHRPVLPDVFETMGVEPRALDAGAMAVAHHRRGTVVALELHGAPSGR
jgi:8-oxo-dGTP diphosphatase